MRRHRPAVVVGLGGFVTGPGGVAAWLTRRPLLIHEQNAIAGFTNRCLAHLARGVLEAFPGSFGADIAAQVIGNPVRAEISAVAAARERFAARSGAIRLLVLGGSQGATRLNAVVPFALARLPRALHLRGAPSVRRALARACAAELCERRRARERRAVHRGHGRGVRLGGSGDLPRRRADHLGTRRRRRRRRSSCRSRPRSTIIRRAMPPIWCAKAPRVLIAERELSAERLAAELARLCAGRGKLLAMAERARLLARPRAAEELAEACLQDLHGARHDASRATIACAASTPSTSSASAAAA